MPRGKPKNPGMCAVCGKSFIRYSGNHKVCSKDCRKTYAKSNWMSVDSQYSRISGNWDKYFARLCVRSHGRKNLTKEMLLEKLAEQKGKCALSGETMTCLLVRGARCPTNASIDRIDPKGPYVESNIQLVCSAVNSFRRDLSVAEYIEWCKKVADYALQEPETR